MPVMQDQEEKKDTMRDTDIQQFIEAARQHLLGFVAQPAIQHPGGCYCAC